MSDTTIAEIVDDFAIELVNEFSMPFQFDSKQFRKLKNMLTQFTRDNCHHAVKEYDGEFQGHYEKFIGENR